MFWFKKENKAMEKVDITPNEIDIKNKSIKDRLYNIEFYISMQKIEKLQCPVCSSINIKLVNKIRGPLVNFIGNHLQCNTCQYKTNFYIEDDMEALIANWANHWRIAYDINREINKFKKDQENK